jgi:hypothetical protein
MRKSLTIVGGSILITLLSACKAANTTQGTSADQQADQNPPAVQADVQNASQQAPNPPPSNQGYQNTAPSEQAPSSTYPGQQNYAQNAQYSNQGAAQPSYEQATRYSTGQIDQMVAPIALYPDALMMQVLMAAAYPYDVSDADQWLQSNRGLSGTNMDDALSTASWDPSVIALCKFPSALDRMAGDIQWTTDLGNAFLNQRSEVMNSIQRLRQEAYRNGHLRTSPQQRVVVDTQYIQIQPYTPNVYYVPYYNPTIVYGSAWNYPNYYYPNVWNPSPYYSPGYSFVNGFAWGIGMSFGNVLFGGYDWNHQNAYINNNVFYGNNIYRNTDYYRNRGMYGGQAHGTWAYNARYNRPNEGFVRAPYAGRAHGTVRGVPAAAVRGGRNHTYLETNVSQGPGGVRNRQEGAGAGQGQHPGGPGNGQGQGVGRGEGPHPGGQGSTGQGQGMGQPPGQSQVQHPHQGMGQGQGKGQVQHPHQGMGQGQGKGQVQHPNQGMGQKQGQGGGKNKPQGAGQNARTHPSDQPDKKRNKNQG